VAKSAHAETIDKAEHTIAATGIYPYRPSIISEKILNRLRTLAKKRCPKRIWKGPKTGIEMFGSFLRVDGPPDLPAPASSTATVRKY
jgi:hypothetical protein